MFLNIVLQVPLLVAIPLLKENVEFNEKIYTFYMRVELYINIHHPEVRLKIKDDVTRSHPISTQAEVSREVICDKKLPLKK